MSETDLQERIKSFLDMALEKISVKDYDNAIEKLKAAEVLDPENPEILYNLGICYCKKELYNTAADYFIKVLNTDFTFVDIIMVYKILSYSLLMNEDYKQAKDYINDGLELSASDVTLLNMLGYIEEHELRFDDAISTYREIIEIDNYNYNAYNSLAYILADTDGDLNEALEYAKKAYKANPEAPAYLDTMGFIHMKKGQLELSKKYLKQALRLMPESENIKKHINELLKIDQS